MGFIRTIINIRSLNPPENGLIPIEMHYSFFSPISSKSFSPGFLIQTKKGSPHIPLDDLSLLNKVILQPVNEIRSGLSWSAKVRISPY